MPMTHLDKVKTMELDAWCFGLFAQFVLADIHTYIYLTTAIVLTPGGSVVVRTISIHRTTQTITERIQITATQ